MPDISLIMSDDYYQTYIISSMRPEFSLLVALSNDIRTLSGLVVGMAALPTCTEIVLSVGKVC